MKNLFPIFVLMFVTSITYAQTEQDIQSVNTSQVILSCKNDLPEKKHSDTYPEGKLPVTYGAQSERSLTRAKNLELQNFGSFSEFPLKEKMRNPYKVRNVGIGFLIGGSVNFGVGYYTITHTEDIGTAILSAGAVLVGAAFIIAGTVTTIVGSIQVHRYAASNLQLQWKGNAVALAYNF